MTGRESLHFHEGFIARGEAAYLSVTTSMCARAIPGIVPGNVEKEGAALLALSQ
jgi:hypothetical protein